MNYSKTEIKINLERIQEKILEAELKSGRPENSVKLQAVSKFHPVQSVLDAIACGKNLFGENRVQEAVQKFETLEEKGIDFELHIIGSLQRNKVKNAIKVASVIESVDRIELLEEIEKQAAKLNKLISVFFEFHTGEESKSGFVDFETLEKAVSLCAEGKFPHIKPNGFMTMAPFTEDEKLIHNSFALMRKTSEKIQSEFPTLSLKELSMGMSGDFEIAIQEGSTQVRVGTAIFGERDYSAQ